MNVNAQSRLLTTIKKTYKFLNRQFYLCGMCFHTLVMLISGHIILLYTHPNRTCVWMDIERFKQDYGMNLNRLFSFVHLMKNVRPFRNLFYYRIRPFDKIIPFFYRKDPAFFLMADKVMPGLVLHHPFSTIINAKYIGRNCTIRHLTTLGNKNKDDNLRPTILDNVDIGSGVTIIGNVTIGNNCVIGAGAVIVKDVGDNCVVVGSPSRIIKRNGMKTNEPM